MIWFFLLSGLFLGWSLGANDAANIFGTAVGTRMVKFKVAAVVASIFVIIGAIVSGAGATHTLGKLGAVNAIAGSFTVALMAGLTVTWMTRLKLPVSTSQSIVGAIIGWNLFTGLPTDYGSLSKIVSTWIICPILSALFAIIIFRTVRGLISRYKIHMLTIDHYNRVALVLIGAFGAYSLGANNIANVMGVFVPASPFRDITLFSMTFTGAQQLFLIGGIAISIGIFTYSKRVMMTVGDELFKLTPVAALTVVLAESLVLFIFASQSLQNWMVSIGLPPIPLVPVSSSQAVIGAVMGIGLTKGGRGINYRILGRIASGWVATPIAACMLTFVALFFVENVFKQDVVKPTQYQLSRNVLNEIKNSGLDVGNLTPYRNKTFSSAKEFRKSISGKQGWNEREIALIFDYAEIDSIIISGEALAVAEKEMSLTDNEISALKQLCGKKFAHRRAFEKALKNTNFPEINSDFDKKKDLLYHYFKKEDKSLLAR